MIINFCSTTGVEADFACEILGASDWDYEKAVNEFFGEPPKTATSSHQKSQMDIDKKTESDNLSLDYDSLKKYADSIGVDIDTARAIKEAELGSSSVGAKTQTTTTNDSEYENVDENDPDYVRAPIKPKLTRLISGGTYQSAQNDAALMYPFFSSALIDSVNTLNNNIKSNGDQFTSSGNEMLSRASPGRDSVFQGNLSTAREVGKKNGKQILVNIQDDLFLSFNLNRDVWKDEVVSSLVKDSFIFFQREKTQEEALKFIKDHKIYNEFPFIGIIDPRTGALIQKLKIKGEGNELRDMILEQITLHLENQPMNATASKVQPSNSMMGGMSSSPPPATSSIAQPNNSFPSTTASIKNTAPSLVSVAAPSVPPPNPPAPKIVSPSIDIPPEPSKDDPDSLSLQFVNFNGQKFQRRFFKSQKIDDVYSFITTKADGRQFDILMTYPNRSLNDMKSQTIEESGISKIALRCKYA